MDPVTRLSVTSEMPDSDWSTETFYCSLIGWQELTCLLNVTIIDGISAEWRLVTGMTHKVKVVLICHSSS